jgi:hypothetical protein
MKAHGGVDVQINLPVLELKLFKQHESLHRLGWRQVKGPLSNAS